MASEPRCPECNGWLDIDADGQRVSLATLLHLPRAPRAIKRRWVHMRWCSYFDRTVDPFRAVSPNPEGAK